MSKSLFVVVFFYTRADNSLPRSCFSLLPLYCWDAKEKSRTLGRKCSGTRVPPFFTSCMRRGFLLMRASFVMLLTTRSDARAQKGVSFYLSACRFPVFLYTNCTSVYLVWQIHFFSDLEMYYACGFVIKAMIICSSQMGVLDFGPALA